MYRYINCISNARGRDIRVPNPLPFSFYFGSKYQESGSQNVHGIRVKLVPNPEKIIKQEFSYMELHGDYTFHQNKEGKKFTNQVIEKARDFFKEYKVLFSAVWESELDENDLRDYLVGRISLEDLIKSFEQYGDYSDILDTVENIAQLEQVVRDNNLFNMND